ncbi:MAG: DUF6396 domain-containing protein [Azoarcus sp.]|jgi:TPR repeat protein|nr:DUF6396 domain-containing protein [Azoarcus sp.]
MHFRVYSAFFPVLLCAAIGIQGCAFNKTDALYAVPTPADHQMMEELDELEDSSEIIQRLLSPFSCTHEKTSLPRLDSDADRLFQHAHWLEMKYERDTGKAAYGFADRRREPNHAEYQKAVWLYRLAAASGHWRASRQLAEMLVDRNNSYVFFAQRHFGSLSLEELAGTTPADIAENLIQRGIPYGYYLKGTLLDEEYGKQGSALWYLRRAADMGQPDAQFAFFKSLQRSLDGRVAFLETQIAFSNRKDEELEKDPEVAEIIKQAEIVRQMVGCAADQGHGDAAYALGEALKRVAWSDLGTEQADMSAKRYAEAVRYFQMATKAGKMEAAEILAKGFNNTSNLKDAEKQAKTYRASPSDENWENFYNSYNFLNLPQDEARSERYEKIMMILFDNRLQGLTVDELDKILPLPPGKLPEWNGEIDWVKRWEKDEAPPLLSEERIAEIAQAKGLEPVFEPKLSTGQLLQLPFTCTHEKNSLMQLEPEVDVLYRHANFLYKKGGSDPCNCDPKAERFYRISGAWGHKKSLQYFLTELRYAHSIGDIPLSLYLIHVAEKLVQRDIPYGYYAMGRILERGESEAWNQKRPNQIAPCAQGDDECKRRLGDENWDAHVKRQEEALRYFRKAAELGSPEAQRHLGEEFGNEEMLRCAAGQGDAEAVESYDEMEMRGSGGAVEVSDVLEKLNSARQAQKAGEKDKANRDFASVKRYLKAASMAGNLDGIIRVLEGFVESPSDRNNLFEGEEGQRRFFLILFRLAPSFLPEGSTSSQSPVTIEEIDRIIHMPLAEIPSWESILQQSNEEPETVLPPLPSEERIREMACAQGLDPETGLPMEAAEAGCVK